LSDLIVDLYAGPGGWDVAAAQLGLGPVVGFEWDAAACQTRAAAGHATVRTDVSRFPLDGLPPRIRGMKGSPPCTTFSNAGKRAGVALVEILGRGIRETFAGDKTRAARRREMAACLRAAWWPSPKLTRAARMAKIWPAVRDAAQVLEPARFIVACDPQWVALEQVPAVLPLWRVYAEELRKLGYSAWCGTLDAADYGVPQRRVRAILIASQAHTVGRPEPTHYDPSKGMQLWGRPWPTMAAALGWGATDRIAPTVTAGGTATGGAEPFGHRDRDTLTAERIAGRWTVRTSFGMPTRGAHEVDAGTEPARVVTSKTRCWEDFPAAGPPGEESLRISVADAAALQSFPPGYPWRGGKTKQHEQVGNAFPPLLAEHVLAMAAGIRREAVNAV
jgi:DNA (cytosine-5)-methyltransferase 1